MGLAAARSLLALMLATTVAYSSGVGRAPTRARLTRVSVNVFGWNTVLGATLIDREGRRTGWNVDRPIREISGCLHEFGSEEGIPNNDAPGDTTSEAPADTVPGGPQPTPMYHYFTVADSADVLGLIHEGGCELRLDPEATGKVQLTLIGDGAGLAECRDTTSVWVKRGAPSRWRLRWSERAGKCNVSIARDALKPTADESDHLER